MARQKLVDFLLTVDKQHVSDLVDILTDFGSGRIALNSTVKNVLISAKESNRPFAKKEIDLLLREFQKYGENTIYFSTIYFSSYTNMMRSIMRSKNSLVSYHEILDNVFKLLLSVGNTSQFTDEEKEQKIVQTLFSNQWESMPFLERYEKSVDMKKFIFKNVTDNPLTTLASSATIVAGEATRITMPFVAQIAWLKMMKQNQQNEHEPKPVKISSSQDLIVADTDSKDAILSLTEYSEPPKIKNEFSSSNISVFSQLFSNIPTLATKLETVRSHIVSINIDPRKLTPAKDGNGLRGMVHGYNENGHFGITENVRIFEAKTLKQVINSGIIFNAVSTAVAQKHLADINEKLKEIQKSLDDIKDFLNNERRSKIEAAIDLVEQVSKHMAKYGQEIPDFDKFKNRLELCLHDNLPIKSHLEKDLDDTCNQIGNIKFDSFMGRNNDSDIQAMIKQMKKWQKNYESYQLCCNVVMMIYAIFYANSYNDKTKEFYVDALKKFISDTNKFMSGKVTQIQKYLRQANENAKGITNFESSELAYEALFDGCIEGFKLHQQKLNKQLTQIATSVTEPMPFKAILQIENGEIQGGQFLLD